MGQPNRDDFTPATRKQLAARVGHRCRNPTCRRPTSRPDPADQSRAISIGVAAHVTGAARGGPRFDGSLASEARKSLDNGIWLCEVCAKVIDDAPGAFTTEGLQAWKRHAELAAVRDSSAMEDGTAALLRDLDAHAALVDFAETWQRGEPQHDFSRFEESTRALIEYGNARHGAYAREVSPKVTAVISRAEVVLGPTAAVILECKQEAMAGPTNYISMRMLADTLQRLRAFLALR